MSAMIQKGTWLTFGLCCVWPLVVHAGLLYITRVAKSRDWNSAQLSDIRWPWSKDE